MSHITQTLDQVAGSVMSQLGISHDKRRLIRQHLIDFLIEYRNNIQAHLKVYQAFPIPQSLTIPMPPDYISYSKVGWVVDGQVKLVAQNRNIAKNLTYDQRGIYRGWPTAVYNNPNGQAVPSQNYGYPVNVLYNNAISGGYISGSIIPELNGFFEEDFDARVIRLSTINSFPNFYMEYVSDCFEPSADTLIHPYAYLAAKAWAEYNYLKRAYNTPVHVIERAARDLDLATIKMRRLIKPMSVIDIISSYDKNLTTNVQ
jgi:hypothetical protein